MSVYSELVNEWDFDPVLEGAWIEVAIMTEKFEPWNLPEIDLLEIWGPMTLRQAFGVFSGGETPTTYSHRMAMMMKVITDPGPSLLGLGEEVVDAEYTRALQVIRDLRADAMDGEVVDDVDI